MPKSNKDRIGTENSIIKSVTVGASSAQIVPATARKAIAITNTSAGGESVTIALTNGEDAVAGTGIVLQPNNTWIDSDSGDYKCWTGRIMGIGSGAGAVVGVIDVPEDW